MDPVTVMLSRAKASLALLAHACGGNCQKPVTESNKQELSLQVNSSPVIPLKS